MKIFKVLSIILLFIFLTILTQIGGVLLFVFLCLSKAFQLHSVSQLWKRRVIKIVAFLVVYFVVTIFVVPPVAKFFGRVSLPILSHKVIKPHSCMTYLLNRHYVTLKMFETITTVSHQFSDKYPNSEIRYLDANFPFLDEFPLLPHLSHDDGKKLDIALFYNDTKTKIPVNDAPSIIGYGVFEKPKKGEVNTAKRCMAQGKWQYSILEKIIPQHKKEDFVFDQKRTKYFIQLLTHHSSVQKIFIEPHLKTRMRLKNSKIRFHGCHAVRHDDHIHFQVN